VALMRHDRLLCCDRAEEIGRKTDYLPVESDGAMRAAQLIAAIL
jgi:hypothetical protein